MTISKRKILIVDDDSAVRASLTLLLKQEGYETVSVDNPADAGALFAADKFDLVVMDMNFSNQTTGEEGLKLLNDIKAVSSNTPIIIITAWGSISLAVKGMKAGAVDFITKPWKNELFLQSIRTAISLYSGDTAKTPAGIDRRKLDRLYDFKGVIGENPKFLEILETIGRISATDAPVLIVGESGTGKELIAEAVHRNSPRKNQPFTKVNLGGISQTLFESEMFGHKRGAFTDAKTDRKGRFELADGGSIFLDEIGELDLNSQVKMLRVLQDRSFEILGSSDTITVDVRVITATNRPLEKMVEEGRFREDLFYRINLITVKIPPLRERKSDITLLLDAFVNEFKTKYQLEDSEITDDAIEWIKNLNLPGNVRELKNLLERTILVSKRKKLRAEDFRKQLSETPPKFKKENLPPIGAMTLNEIEKSMIIKALEHHNHNLSQTAKSLGISRAALYRRIEKYGIDE